MEIALFLLGAVTFIIGLMFISGSSFEKGTWWFFLIGIAFLGISSWSGSLREKIETEKQVARWLPTTCDSIRFDQPVNRKKKEEYLKKLLEEKKLPVEKPLQKLEKALDMRITEIIKRQAALVEAGLSEKDAADRRRIATKLAAKMASDLNDPHFPEPVVLMLCMHNFALSEAASTTEGKTTEAVLDLRYLAGKIVAAAWSEPSSGLPQEVLQKIKKRLNNARVELSKRYPMARIALYSESNALIEQQKIREALTTKHLKALKSLNETGPKDTGVLDRVPLTQTGEAIRLVYNCREASKHLNALKEIWPGSNGHPVVINWMTILDSASYARLTREVIMAESCRWPFENSSSKSTLPIKRFLFYFIIAGIVLYMLVHAFGHIISTVLCTVAMVALSIPLWHAANVYYPSLFHAWSGPIWLVWVLGMLGFAIISTGLLRFAVPLMVMEKDEWPVLRWNFIHGGNLVVSYYQCPVCSYSAKDYFGKCPKCNTHFGGSNDRLSEEEQARRKAREEAYLRNNPERRAVLLLHFLALSMACVVFLHMPFFLASTSGYTVITIIAVIVIALVAVMSVGHSIDGRGRYMERNVYL